MFSRVGAGQSVNFRILDREPDKLRPGRMTLIEDLDVDGVTADDEYYRMMELKKRIKVKPKLLESPRVQELKNERKRPGYGRGGPRPKSPTHAEIMDRINARHRNQPETQPKGTKVGKKELKHSIEQALHAPTTLKEKMSYEQSKIQIGNKPEGQKLQIERWRQKIKDAKNGMSQSFMAIDREKAAALKRYIPPGNQNLAKYSPKFNLI